MHLASRPPQSGPPTTAVEFGYNPPTGARGIERINPATFVSDLAQVVEFSSGNFDSVWVSDHLMMADKFRLECWTQLTWIATRYPTLPLGTNVMSQTFHHPPLLGKMIASLQALRDADFRLGYGAG